LVDIIAVGCAKMISSITSHSPRKHSRAHSHKEVKSLTSAYIFFALPEIFEKKEKFRPSDIRNILPENLRNISSADLTRILDNFVRLNILSKPVREAITKKWGRPSRHISKESGPKSFYRPSVFYNNMRNVLSKSKAVKIVYALVLESGLLYRYHKHSKLISYHLLRSKDRKIVWNILRSVNMAFLLKESDLEAEYEKIKYVANNKDLNSIAHKEALSSIYKHNGEDYIKLYLSGGLFFKL
jgi:hypothetical protein